MLEENHKDFPFSGKKPVKNEACPCQKFNKKGLEMLSFKRKTVGNFWSE